MRFRPIMMTTMAALIGTLPIALGFGAGAESRRPLGLAVVGGLLFSQMLTFYVTPVFYVYMDHLAEWLKRRRGEKAEVHPVRKKITGRGHGHLSADFTPRANLTQRVISRILWSAEVTMERVHRKPAQNPRSNRRRVPLESRHHTCIECPACGSETCKTLQQLGMYLPITAVAATEAWRAGSSGRRRSAGA